MNRQTKFVVGILSAVVLVAVGGFAYGYLSSTKNIEESRKAQREANESVRDTNSAYVTYEGKKYKYNSDLKNILFLGIDKREEFKFENAGHGGQSDCIIVLAMDQKNKKTTMLQLSRDAMTDVKIFSISGDYLATEKMQITAQYAYGDGGKRSCQLTKNAVSDLLYEIPIRSYISMNIEGIGIINDAIGGVNLTIPEDYTNIDPAFVQGQTVKMTREQAERYVRYRDTTVTGSNNQRMERQTQFIRALFSQLKQSKNTQYDDIWAAVQPHTVTDMKLEEVKALATYEIDENILKVPGETVAGEEHDEYHVDTAALQKMIIDIFYIPVES